MKYQPKEEDYILAIVSTGNVLIGKMNSDGDMLEPFEVTFIPTSQDTQSKGGPALMPDMHKFYLLERHKYIDRIEEQPFIIQKKGFITPYYKPTKFVIDEYVKLTTGIEVTKNIDNSLMN